MFHVKQFVNCVIYLLKVKSLSCGTINGPSSAERVLKSAYLCIYRYFVLQVPCFFCFSCPALRAFFSLSYPSRFSCPSRSPPFFAHPSRAFFFPPLGALSLLALAFLDYPSLTTHCAFSASPPFLQPKQFLRLWRDEAYTKHLCSSYLK